MTQTATQKRAIREGTISIAVNNGNGTLGPFYPFVSSKTGSDIKWTTEKISHMESESGLNQKIVSITTGKDGKVTLVLESQEKNAIAIGLRGTTASVVSGTATAETVPNTTTANLTVGGFYPLEKFKATAAPSAIVDSTPTTPVALVSGTHYIWHAELNAIELLDKTSLIGPLKATYAYSGSDTIGMMTESDKYHYVRCNTINRAKNNEAELTELYKVIFEPMDNYAIKADGIITFTLTGELLVDDTHSASDAMGQFGRITRVV